MNLSAQIAKHLRDVHFGGNWTTSNLKDVLSDVTWEQAIARTGSLNSIVSLVYHVNYFIDAVLKVLQGEELSAKDIYSFDHPPIGSQEDWSTLLAKVWKDAEIFAALIEQLPDNRMEEDFVDSKYGSYYRNLQGIIEHTHYHLGQIAIIKKLLNEAQ